MTEKIETIRDRILDKTLPYVSATGWSWDDVMQASTDAGYQDNMAEAVFPGGLNDVVAHFSDWADRNMLKALDDVHSENLRVRERIKTAISMRYKFLDDYKEIVRASLVFWSAPNRVLQGQRVLWRTADRMWDWAGDTATDYNRQTKRALLCSILLGSSMVWIEDRSAGYTLTHQFVDRRIENVMAIGRALGTIRGTLHNQNRQTN